MIDIFSIFIITTYLSSQCLLISRLILSRIKVLIVGHFSFLKSAEKLTRTHTNEKNCSTENIELYKWNNIIISHRLIKIIILYDYSWPVSN